MDAISRLFIELDVWLSQPEVLPIPGTSEAELNERRINWHKALISTVAEFKIPSKLKNSEAGTILNKAINVARNENPADLDHIRNLIFSAHQSVEKLSSIKLPQNPKVEEMKKRLTPNPDSFASGEPNSDAIATATGGDHESGSGTVDYLFSFLEDELREILDDPSSMFMKSSENAGNEERVLALEDSWSIIRHLLSKASKNKRTKNKTILDCGIEFDVEEDEIYRVYRPKEVVKIAAKLKSTPFKALADVFEIEDMEECDRGIDESEKDSTLEYMAPKIEQAVCRVCRARPRTTAKAE